jgi:cytochrome c-type biogenesis protein CcmH
MDPSPTSLDTLKAQLAQLDGLIAEGVLTGAVALSAREALERKILQSVLGTEALPATPTTPTAPPEAPAAVPTPSTVDSAPRRATVPRRMQAGVAAFVLAVGGVGYAWMGNHDGWNVSPGQIDAAGAQGSSHSTQAAQIEEMVGRLVERLKTHPDDAMGWSMLARSYTAMGRPAEALPAYKKVLDLQPQSAQAMADYADALAVVNQRTLDGEPEQLIMRALELDPANVKALSLAGTVSYNRGEFKLAAERWERAIQVSEPGSDFTQQLQGALDDARRRAGLPPLAAAAPPAAPPAASPVDAMTAAGGAAAPAAQTISGRVELGPAAKASAAPDDTVFIFARAPQGSRMPLAILRKRVSDLPLDFKLDDSLAMSPAARLSSSPQVVVGARLSKSGNAAPSPGDWQVLSAPVALGAQGLRLEINEAVR